MLLSKSLLIERSSFSGKTTKSGTYRIDSTFKKFVLARASKEEIKDCEDKVTQFIIDKLKYMYTNQGDDELVLIEGNVLEALARIKRNAIKNKNSARPTPTFTDNEDLSNEESWVASEEEQDIVIDNLHFESKAPAQPKLLLRSSTYQARKDKALHKFHKNEENSVSCISESISDFEDDEQRSQYTNIPITVGAFQGDATMKPENKRKAEKETVKVISEL